MAIRFYRERDAPYGCFSNFSKHSFEIDGQPWQTVEHYFQAQKFVGTPREHEIQIVSAPMTAKIMGNDRAFPVRADWETVKDDVMREALRAKFAQHDDIRAVLLETGTETLIEAAPNDYYWGCGQGGIYWRNMTQIPLSSTRRTVQRSGSTLPGMAVSAATFRCRA